MQRRNLETNRLAAARRENGQERFSRHADADNFLLETDPRPSRHRATLKSAQLSDRGISFFSKYTS